MLPVEADHIDRNPIPNQLAPLDNHAPRAKRQNHIHVVANNNNRLSRVTQSTQMILAFLLEELVANRQNLIDQQYIGIHKRPYRESQSQVHPRGVMLHRRVHELLQFGESHNLRQTLLQHARRYPQKRAR